MAKNAKIATHDGLIKSRLLLFDFSSSKTWELTPILMFMEQIQFFVFYSGNLPKKTNNLTIKEIRSKNITIGVNSHVFDDEKSNKSNLELIRATLGANGHLYRVAGCIPGDHKLAHSINLTHIANSKLGFLGTVLVQKFEKVTFKLLKIIAPWYFALSTNSSARSLKH